ncbi:MAG: radical SAM protein [Deltaproteobacteria bacterium]|nr:radical SAM protein [Deltaproteobacteria bacterium]
MKSVALEVTAHCNQKCAYCYNAWRDNGGKGLADASTAELRRVLDLVLADPELEHVTLTGGEPLLRKDLAELIDVVRAAGRRVLIISNGGPDPELDVRFLAQKAVAGIQVTLAGASAAVHDAHCGAGSYVRTTAAIARMRAHGVRVLGSYLCTAQSWPDAQAVLEQFAAAGIQQVAFNRFNPSGYATDSAQDLLPTRTQVLHALRAADAAAPRLGLKIPCTMPIPPCVVERKEFPNIRFGSCSAGTAVGEPALNASGDLRLCTLQKGAVGNLFAGDGARWLELPGVTAFRQAIPAFCQGCAHQATCLGGCGAAAEWRTGRAAELDPFVARHVEPGYF